MNQTDNSSTLFEAMARFPEEPALLKSLLAQGSWSGETVTRVAIQYVQACDNEDGGYYEAGPSGAASDRPLSNALPDLISLLLPYGLDPNAVYDGDNLMYRVCWVNAGFAAADALALLLAHGGDPMVSIDGEPLFDRIDFDVVFGAFEMYNRQRYSAVVHCWLVLVGYGGRPPRGETALKVFRKFDSDETFDCAELKDHRRFTYGLSRVPGRGESWSLQIFDRQTMWEVARL